MKWPQTKRYISSLRYINFMKCLKEKESAIFFIERKHEEKKSDGEILSF